MTPLFPKTAVMNEATLTTLSEMVAFDEMFAPPLPALLRLANHLAITGEIAVAI